MNFFPTPAVTTADDTELVALCLSGHRSAFAEIVSRYQALVSSLAYSATGSLSQSEDLAQETFVAAWGKLGDLREPSKLRSWLCGIARNLIHNALRRQGREPSHRAESLDTAEGTPALDLAPSDQAVSAEEAAILWRSLERIPETYREPLVLFYREHQSIQTVAEQLELSEDAVKQRLSRGRKLLQDEVQAFVEGALRRTVPGEAFTAGVMAALPVFATSASVAAGATAAKGGAMAKAATATALIGAILAPVAGLISGYLGYRIGVDSARSEEERALARSLSRKLMSCILSAWILFVPMMIWGVPWARAHRSPWVPALVIGGFAAYLLSLAWVLAWSFTARRRLAPARPALAAPAFEYRSRIEFLGLPLVHVRFGSPIGGGLTRGWIAVGGRALGGLFAYGGVAVAPVAVGGLAIGLLPIGGCAAGLLAVGGFACGAWAYGALAAGWLAMGGVAVAWRAAWGNLAVAHDFARGGAAFAAQAGNGAAVHYVLAQRFFQVAYAVAAHPGAGWANLAWFAPLAGCWLYLRARRRAAARG